MKIVNFGSINIDHVYRVQRFVAPGETIPCADYQRLAGGKGMNQSIALARAGANTVHAGCIGEDGRWLLPMLVESGADITSIRQLEKPSGHAIIQVNNNGENCIIIHGGANRLVTNEHIREVFSKCQRGDWLLLQNETNAVEQIIEAGYAAGMKILFNPAPFTDEVAGYPLDKVDILTVNETEGKGLSGESDVDRIVQKLAHKFPRCEVIVTLGEDGALFEEDGNVIQVKAFNVQPVDTTAAGDCFVGYFLAAYSDGNDMRDSLRMACAAAAICVTRHGAAPSIPSLDEVEAMLMT